MKKNYTNYKRIEESLQKKWHVFHDEKMRGKHDKRFCAVCEYSNDEICFYDMVAGKKDKKYPCARAYEKLREKEDYDRLEN